jgi:hypothetical protein
VEQRKNHGDKYLEYQWQIANKTLPVLTPSEHWLYVTANRVQSIEARNALKITFKSSLAVAAIAFLPSGEFYHAKVLLEKGPQEYTWVGPIATTPVLHINWTVMHLKARYWARGLSV